VVARDSKLMLMLVPLNQWPVVGTYRFKSHGTLVNSSKLFNLQGDFTGQYKSFKEDQAKLEDKYGIRPFVLGWHEIRQLLHEHLPPDLVEFDKQVQPATSCHWSTRQASVATARHIIMLICCILMSQATKFDSPATAATIAPLNPNRLPTQPVNERLSCFVAHHLTAPGPIAIWSSKCVIPMDTLRHI